MNVLKFELKRLLKSGVIWGVVNGALVLMFMLFFPSMEKSGLQAIYEAELKAFPEGFMEAFGIDLGIDFTNIIDYLAYVIQYIAMASCVYGAILGVNSLIKEESEGTIEFLYAQPIRRRDIVTNKIASSAIIYALYLSILWVITVISCILVKPDMVNTVDILGDISMIFVGMAFVGYVFMAIGLFLSTVIKNSKRAVPMAIALFFISFLLGVLGKLKESLSFFKYFSPFDYASPSEVIKNGIELVNLSIGVIIITVGIAVTYYLYERKDMRI